MKKYHAVSVEPRFTEEVGLFEVYTIEKSMSSRKGIEKWINDNSRHECVIMTQKQYDKTILSQRI